MRRPRFSLKTMLWLIAVVAAFFAGRAWKEREFTIERHDWATLINGQEEKHKWVLSEYHRLRRREFKEQQQALNK
jgi:hypothetical protein